MGTTEEFHRINMYELVRPMSSKASSKPGVADDGREIEEKWLLGVAPPVVVVSPVRTNMGE